MAKVGLSITLNLDTPCFTDHLTLCPGVPGEREEERQGERERGSREGGRKGERQAGREEGRQAGRKGGPSNSATPVIAGQLPQGPASQLLNYGKRRIYFRKLV